MIRWLTTTTTHSRRKRRRPPRARATGRFVAGNAAYRIRPVRPGDEPALRRMLEDAPPEDIRLRFFRYVRHFPHEFLEPLIRSDGDRHFACVAVPEGQEGEIAASAMLVREPDTRRAEFGIFVGRPHAGRRLGSHLMRCLLGQARAHRIEQVHGTILAENATMIDLAKRTGFRIRPDAHDPACVRAEVRVMASRRRRRTRS